MRSLATSTLLLALLALTVLMAGVCRANEPVVLTLRSATDVGLQAKAAKGPAGEPAIEVAGGAEESRTTLAVLDNPAISSPDYVLRGRVKYNDVVGNGYLELLNHFGDDDPYFSRTLLDFGPMQKLTGTSDWRDFELPFYAEGMKPRRLTLNVVLPGTGSVTVAEPLVVAPLIVNRGWWTERQAGLIGGGLGTLGGALGSLIGIAAALRKFALARALCGVGLAAGAVSLIAGVVAVCVGQPWHVWYPLLLIGFISMSVCGPLLVLGSRLFQADELRRMTGLDAM